MLNYVGSTTHGGGGIVAMFCHLVTCACNDETGCCGNVEGVLPVTACAHHIDIAVCFQQGGNTCFQDTVTETEQFIYGWESSSWFNILLSISFIVCAITSLF